MDSRPRLIDWMMIIAISALGLATFVMWTRDGSEHRRRAPCQNNLRELALALNAYAGVHGGYPPTADLTWGHSCFLLALPFMERNDLYNAYNLSLENWSTVANGGGTSNAEISRTAVNVMICPNNPNRDETPASAILRLDGRCYPSPAFFAKSHYGVNWGGGRQGWGRDFELTKGVDCGAMSPNGLVPFSSFRDGSGSTILMGEKKDSFGWNVGGWAGNEFDAGIQPAYEGDDPLARKVYSGSYHGGGLNFAFADGSVRYLSNGIERSVWYAILTRKGRENIDQDSFIQ